MTTSARQAVTIGPVAAAIAIALIATPALAQKSPAPPMPCDEAAVDRIARLLLEIPRAAPDRQKAIGPEIARWLRASVDQAPTGDEELLASKSKPCLIQALARAQRILGGGDAGPPATAPDASAAMEMAKRSVTLARLRQVSVALHAYMAESDVLPGDSDGLRTLVDKGILRREDLLDGWGRAVIYRSATGDPTEFELTSAGPDGMPHTEDDVSLPFP